MAMNLEDKQIIEEMEAKYDSLAPKLKALSTAVEDFEQHYADYIALRDFYGSTEWFRLFEQPHADIKSGVLSEDQLYNFISDHNALLATCLELAAKMSKNM
ncbi:DUF4298 domain-containing protein [Streptococcus pluranimalium]|uniref:DUF4298 domain-containing protein n=1 Tax=Streptococcus pluranimalium TaxID=82348 RepID=UPI003F690915